MINVVAILAVRNEALYMERVIEHLIAQGIDLAIIDHDSEDETRAICERYHPGPVRLILHEPFHGVCDLERMLEIKEELRRTLKTDWVIHHDADELMESPRRGETLREAIHRVDRAGYDAINFDEYLFVYETNEVSYEGTDYFQTMRHYYFFEPEKIRLVRAFRNDLPVTNISSGGHRLPLDSVNLHPENFILRHYISFSRDYAQRKYLSRVFRPDLVARGWHRNRVNIAEKDLAAPPLERLSRVNGSGDIVDRSRPYLKHFWEWDSES